MAAGGDPFRPGAGRTVSVFERGILGLLLGAAVVIVAASAVLAVFQFVLFPERGGRGGLVVEVEPAVAPGVEAVGFEP